MCRKGIGAENFWSKVDQPGYPSPEEVQAPQDYGKYLYGLRRLVENAFLELKHWLRITTRYAKNMASFLAVVHIRVC